MDITNIGKKYSQRLTVDKQPVSSPTLLVLVGLQYAGKSYLAEKIEEQNFLHFWATKLKKEFNVDNNQMNEIALMMLDELLPKGFNVVIDFVNHKRETRRKFQEKAARYGANYSVVFMDTPRDERLRRREENKDKGDTPGRRLISLQQMQEFESAFEIPSADENVHILQNNTAIEKFLDSLTSRTSSSSWNVSTSPSQIRE